MNQQTRVPVRGLFAVLCGFLVFTHLIAVAGEPRSISSKQIEHLYRLAPKIFSGAQPEGEGAFRELQSRGIKTILSVDGAKPDVKTAKRFGLRTVHLPIGYDGITAERGLQIAKAAGVLPGPIFVHCHHGKHRGPAAAALCCRAVAGWDDQRALAWLKRAGTSPKYTGLFRSVREFQIPSAAVLAKIPADFPEIAELPTMVESMVAIGGYGDRLKLIAKAGFMQPKSHPDIDPPHEALQLAEQFRELARTDDAKQQGLAFVKLLQQSDATAMDLHASLTVLQKRRDEKVLKRAEKSLGLLRRQCVECHRRFRDGGER